MLRSARELIGHSLGPVIGLALELDSAGIWVTTDPDQLELAILNLAVNSRDALPDGGRIRIESAACEARLAAGRALVPCVAIRVIDDGAGMTSEVLAKAVEAVLSPPRSAAAAPGSASHRSTASPVSGGGDLRIASTPGAGTTVEILLRQAPSLSSTPELAILPAVSDHAWARGQQVLVIDDDDGVRGVIAAALTLAGFEVIEATDGESGLLLLEKWHPVAAVIDFLMPGMNGAEVARIAQARRPGLPIVFVSGYSDTVALDGIADAIVLRKPFDTASLNRALSTVLH